MGHARHPKGVVRFPSLEGQKPREAWDFAHLQVDRSSLSCWGVPCLRQGPGRPIIEASAAWRRNKVRSSNDGDTSRHGTRSMAYLAVFSGNYMYYYPDYYMFTASFSAGWVCPSSNLGRCAPWLLCECVCVSRNPKRETPKP